MTTDRDLAAEMASPKYAYIERERRWLADRSLVSSLCADEATLIDDLYIAETRLRLRRMTRRDGWVSYKLTKKYESLNAAERPIVTTYLQQGEYDVLASLSGRRILKQRHSLPYGDHHWSIDCFEGRLAGLVIAELEIADAALLKSINVPHWALCEITHQQRWQGGALAQLEQIPED